MQPSGLAVISSVRSPSVAFYTQGLRTPSARFRVEQLLAPLRQRGLGCTVYAANPSNQGETRHWSPPPGSMRKLLRAAAVPVRVCQLPRALRHDVVVFQKPLLPFPSACLERAIARRRPCVFDLDDALYLKPGGRRWIREIVAACAYTIAGSQHLAEQIAAPDRTLVLPTVVDTQRYTVRAPPEGPFTIGWTGIAHNLPELEPLVPVLGALLRRIGGRLLLVAERFPVPWLRSLPVETITWSPQAELDALSRMHVGLMPLVDSDFNRGKCAFKLIQYMARGIPVVASPVGANVEVVRHGVDGFLARTEKEWSEALHALHADADAALAMGSEARRRIEMAYSVEAVIGRYEGLFRSLYAARP